MSLRLSVVASWRHNGPQRPRTREAPRTRLVAQRTAVPCPRAAPLDSSPIRELRRCPLRPCLNLPRAAPTPGQKTSLGAGMPLLEIARRALQNLHQDRLNVGALLLSVSACTMDSRVGAIGLLDGGWTWSAPKRTAVIACSSVSLASHSGKRP
eukprot:1929465-Pleurochrysis_carterae.AAC.1